MSNNPLKTDFKAKQLEFAAYIRDPDNHPIPLGIKKKRMQIYRQLFFNNVEGFLAGNFPVLRQLLTDDQWLALVQDFFATHHSTTPYFVEIPEEFLDYLQNERQNPDDFPFLLELAHYEWVEMALSIARESIVENSLDLANILHSTVRLSPLAWPLAYSFPVHKISPQYVPLSAPEQPTFLMVYRDQDDDVQFMELTPITYQLLDSIQQHEQMIVETCLLQIAQDMQHPQPVLIINAGLQTLTQLAEKAIVILS